MTARLTRYEWQLLETLWKLGRASVREIQEGLAETRRPAYTTVQTMVYRLEEKGAVRRVKKIGNAHIFEPVLSRQKALKRVVHEFLAWFGGEPRPLVAHLVEYGKLTLEDIQAIEKSLRAKKEKA